MIVQEKIGLWRFKVNIVIKRKGWHLSDKGQEIIKSLSNRINNNSLSTNKNSLINTIPKDLDLQIQEFLKNTNLEVHDNGKIWIKSSKKYLKGRGNIQINSLNESPKAGVFYFLS
jgi:hypothetical protein